MTRRVAGNAQELESMMNQTNAAAAPDLPEEQLNRAIEELRGVLHDEQRRPESSPAVVEASLDGRAPQSVSPR